MHLGTLLRNSQPQCSVLFCGSAARRPRLDQEVTCNFNGTDRFYFESSAFAAAFARLCEQLDAGARA